MYDVLGTAKDIFRSVITDPKTLVPKEARDLANHVTFEGISSPEELELACPFKQCETISALKAVEASVANALGKLRYGFEQDVKIDLTHATLFLLMAYVASVDGMTKLDPKVKQKLKDTDLLQAQSNLYRRMSANLYKTKDGKYYHIHGSLEASTTLNMIGLPAFTDLTDYEEIINYIGSAVAKFSASELEKLNNENRQAGTIALTQEQFLQTEHGKIISQEGLWDCEVLESDSAPASFEQNSSSSSDKKPQILQGIKVIEMCRIIAGPTIGRILAEYGAEVIKITSPNLSDVPFFQVDCNAGKHTADLDLKSEEGKKQFNELIADADVVIDGYRTDALSKLGYGPKFFAELGKSRNKGVVYVSENCFGFTGPWSYRPGWQQIADCVSGLAWAQGRALGREEPIIPPFPMSDYGTGCLGAIAALNGLYQRATVGGSYWAKTSLVQYDLLLMAQGQYPQDVWDGILSRQSDEFKQVRYYDSVDKISGSALQGLHNGQTFSNINNYLQAMDAPGFKGEVKVLKPVVQMDKTDNRFNCASRPNGYDPARWW